MVWDAFVASSKNGTFLLQRDYLDYHADRFTDHSLLFYRKGKLIALLPANQTAQEVQSHGGLTYGGVISDGRMRTGIMLEVFEAMLAYYQGQGVRHIKYKAIPHIYHQLPSEEDLYALFRYQAVLYRRDVNSVVDINNRLPYSVLRKRKLKQAPLLVLEKSMAYDSFMQLKRELLQEKYQVMPAHSTAEILRLASCFPDNISLYTASEVGVLVAGIVIYETPTVAHAQYIGATARGLDIGALDVLTDWLLTEVYVHKKYFSFGVSTEQQGQYLNEGLARNKESYGGRTVVHDFYELAL